jgi:hypothetical protein
MASLTAGFAKDLAACKQCSGWEKWGKIANKQDIVGSADSTTGGLPDAASSRSTASGTPRKDAWNDSEMRSVDVTPRRSETAEDSGLTPRLTPATSPRVTVGLSSNAVRSKRRNSKASFVETLGLNTNLDAELVGFEDVLEDSLVHSSLLGGDTQVSTINFVDSDDDLDDDQDDDEKIYDEYDFDNDKIAEMIQAGVDREKLTSVIEEAMAASLERKLKAKTMAPLGAVISSDNPYATGALQPGETTYDLAGHMTPGRMTPSESTAAPIDSQTVAERMRCAVESAKLRRRRSSATGKYADTIDEARRMAAMKRRASLNAHMGDCMQETISEAMRNANRRHRQSISKAAEILEDVGYDDSTQVTEIATKMNMIEVAMAEARRRHRRSIAEAVEQLQERPVGSTLNTSAQVFTPHAELCYPGDFQHNADCSQAFVPASAVSYPGDLQPKQGCNVNAEAFVPGCEAPCPGAFQQSACNTIGQAFAPVLAAAGCQQGSWNSQCQQGVQAFVPVAAVGGCQQGSWNSPCQEGWEASAPCLQARINQAITSAYQDHCYMEQQSYASYEGTSAHYDANYQCISEQHCAPVVGYCQDYQQNQETLGYDDSSYNQCSQAACMQMQSYHTCNDQDGSGWDQVPDGPHYSEVSSCAQTNMVGMYSQYNEQATSQYCHDPSFNQGAAWEMSAESWDGGNHMAACTAYAQY